MAQTGPNTTLSRPARLLTFLGPPSIILTTTYFSPRTGLFSSLAFLPTCYAWTRYRRALKTAPSHRADFEPLVWTYALCATAGVAVSSAVQAVVGYGLTTLFYGRGEERRKFFTEVMRADVRGLDAETLLYRAETAKSLKYRAFVVILLFTAAGVGEEVLKMLGVFYARRRAAREKRKPRKWEYLDYVLSSSLAFGVVEGIGFLYSACETSRERGWKLTLTVCERLIIGSSGHVLMAVLSALRATRRDYGGKKGMSWWKVVGPAAVIHGAFDVGALLFSASEGHVGWIHPEDPVTTAYMLTIACGFWGVTAWLVRRELKLLEYGERKEK